VWFISFSHEHPPPHVHGAYAETVVVIDLLADGTVAESDRTNAVQPASAKRSDVRHILKVAEEHAAELFKLWENTHG
jgi:hypothetical protein